MSLKLYTYPDNNRAWKVLVVAQYNNIDIELPAFDFDKDIKSESFKKKTPVGKVPLLETPQGNIFESGAIARYVARMNNQANLLGCSAYQQGEVDQWVDWCTNELEPARSLWLYPIMGYLSYNEKVYTEAKKDITSAMTILNKVLESRTFLVGNAVTLADITIVTSLVHLYSMVFTSKFLTPFLNVTRWFQTCVNQPEFSKVVGKVEFAKEEAQPPKADKKAAAGGDKKPAAAAKDDEDKPKAQKKSSLDDLPASSMDMDTTKKLCFSQRPVLKEFFERLWTVYDPAGYCWFTCDYKYNADNKEFWKLGNVLGGFVQRSDAWRKNAMGTIQVAGPEDENSAGPWDVTGAWMFRGTGMLPAEMMQENPDAEHYTWTKIDTNTDAGKQKIKEYFMGETVNGKKVLDRRYVK